MSGAAITLTIGDNSHSAVANNKNLDGSAASGVTTTFSSDDASICAVDPTTGALTPVAVGSIHINENSSRGAFSHSDFGTVTVIANVSDDFTTELTFS